MRLKHIKLFLSQKVSQMLSQMPAFEELCEKIQQINDNPSTKAIGDLENSEQIQEFLKCYEEFSNETKKGKHGMTVKYWYVYAEEIVANHLHMSRAVRTNDIDFSYLSWGKCIFCKHTDQTMPDIWCFTFCDFLLKVHIQV